MFPFMWRGASDFASVSEMKNLSVRAYVSTKTRFGYLFPIRGIDVIRGACAFFFVSHFLRKLLAVDLIITRNWW